MTDIDMEEVLAEQEIRKKKEIEDALSDGRSDCMYNTNCDEDIWVCNSKCLDYKKRAA